MEKVETATTSLGTPSPPDLATPSSGTPRPPRPAPVVPDHELLRPIGHGAYGEVWLARNVVGTWRAVKVVHRADFSEDYPFEREFKGIQKFEPVSRSHEGLIDILQIGRNDEAGYFYYVMELADDANAEGGTRSAEFPHPASGHPLPSDGRGAGGEGQPGISHSVFGNPHSYVPHTLRHELKQRGHLPPDECVAIGFALSGALDHLHAQGLVHRDIKPSNIIFVHGVPKLADIGLVADASEARSFVGTVGFIAPEGPGSPQADLYSLGKVLYEAATGLDRGRFPDLPEDLKDWPDAARVIEMNEVILKACANDLRQRHSSARALHDELTLLQRGGSVQRRRWWEKARGLAAKAALTLAVVALPALIAIQLARHAVSPPASVSERASIFVLPFRSAGTNELLRLQSRRITDAFIDSLALIEGVRVGPRKSGWVLRDEDEVRREVGKALNVRHALTGRVATPPGQISIEVSFFETEGDRKLWSETFVGGTNEIIELETKALHRIATKLGLEITPEEQQRIHQKLTNNWEALRLRLLAGPVILQNTKQSYAAAVEMFNRALDLDPNFLDADVWIGNTLHRQIEDRDPREIWPEIKTRMQKVLRMDDTDVRARYWLCRYEACYEWHWEAVKAEVGEPQKPSPGFVREPYYRMMGWTNEARALREETDRNADPQVNLGNSYFSRGAAALLYVDRQPDAAIEMAEQGLKWHPDSHRFRSLIASAQILKQDYSNALATIARGLAVERKQELVALAAIAYAMMGDQKQADERLNELNMVKERAYLNPYCMARVFAALGDKQEVWKWLKKAVEDRSEWLVNPDMGGLRFDLAWDDLREEPEFKELLKQVGLDVWPR